MEQGSNVQVEIMSDMVGVGPLGADVFIGVDTGAVGVPGTPTQT